MSACQPTPIADGEAVIYDAANGGWLWFRRPQRILAARTPAEVLPALAAAERAVLQEDRHAAGFVAYEAAPACDPALAVRPCPDFPLAWFALYDPPLPLPLPEAPDPPATPWSWTPSVTPEDYARALAAIRRLIRAGDTYQVNYTLRLRAPQREDPWPLFLRMVQAQGPGYGAFVRAGRWTVCSASPELFLSRDGDRLLSRPMKGTAPRGLWSAADRAQAEALRRSEKNRAENVMIVDMVRNDLGRIAAPGSVRAEELFRVERYPTVWQMTSAVSAATAADWPDIFRAAFPPASITGAPKVRTMQIIAALETDPRRVYTGAVGFLAPPRRAQFNVAIRTVLADRAAGAAEYGVGGGIVWDSEPAGEWAECLVKAQVLDRPAPPFALLETLRWTPEEGYRHLERHLRRLAESAAYFGRVCDPEAARAELLRRARSFPAAARRVRLRAEPDGRLAIEEQPLAPLPAPYRLRLAEQPVNARDPLLYHKTTAREGYERAQRQARAAGADDALLWNERGEITESCIANVIAEIDGRRLTPPLRCGLLGGVERAALLEAGAVTEGVLRVADLPRCAALFLCNSLRGLWPAVCPPLWPPTARP